MRRYFAPEVGFATFIRFASGTPDQGTAIAQASTQRCR